MDLSNYRVLQNLRLTPRQRQLIIGVLVALSSQFYLTAWARGFRISAAAILYPALLVTMMRDSHRPDTGLITGLCVLALRTALSLLQGASLADALITEYPGGVFYLCYDLLLCLLVRDRRTVSPPWLLASLWVCDLASNALNLLLSSQLRPGEAPPPAFFSLAGLALIRSFTACAILLASQGYHQLLLRSEHEHRYHRLFLLTANLRTELYFLKKDSEDIEAVMSHAYRLYERLEKAGAPEELSSLALAIAREVHEVKKDNLLIIRGLEENVAQTYDHQDMSLSDLLHILDASTRQFLGQQRADIRLEYRYQQDFPVREHYRLLSILKNLVTNAVEAIQAGPRRGLVSLNVRVEGEQLHFTVADDGPGISPRACRLLFQVGYSTKFDADTGNINRGVGLPAVRFIVEELGGSIQVDSQPGRGAVFSVCLPMRSVSGGELP